MGQYLDMAAGNAALKENYDGDKIQNLAYDDRPLLAMMPKNTSATGKYVTQPIIYEVSQGRSHTFANSQGNQTPGLLAEFLVPLRADYSTATLGNQAMLASQGSAGSFLDFATMFVDLAIQSAANNAAMELYRAGTGSRGRISTIAAGVIELSNPADIVNFGYNQTLQANSTDGGSPKAALGYVVGRNVQAGTITVSSTALGGAAGSPSGWAANDFLLVQGDNNAAMVGFAGWLPSTAPASTDNFNGVNRSVDSRLYGTYLDGDEQPLEEAFVDATLLNRRENGRPKHLFTNFGSLAQVEKALGTKCQYVNWTMGEIGFEGLKIRGAAGVVECYGDRSCQPATAWLIQLNTWKLHSLNPVPHIFRYGDQLEMLRLSNADASEVRAGLYANPVCSAPGWNTRIALQS